MALKPCRECGEPVSTEAKKCPHCGVGSPVLSEPPGKGCAIGCGALMILALVLYALGEASKSREREEIATGWAGEPVIEIPAIAGRSRDEISARYGEPDSMKTEQVNGREYPVGYYGDGAFEVVFVNGSGEWLTIWGRGRIPYSEAALPAMGLAARRPTEETQIGLRWENIPGILELNLFSSDVEPGTAHYAFVEVRRPI